MMEQMTLTEAARVLGLSPEALRARLLRGTMKGEKDEEGRWRVWVDREEAEAQREAQQATEAEAQREAQRDPDREGPSVEVLLERIEALQQRVTALEGERDFLRRQLDNMVMSQAMAAQAQAQKALESSESPRRRSWWPFARKD